MKIAIFGTGYVGLVTGACFASAGMKITCVDTDADKIEMLKKGGCPIVEVALPERIQRGMKSGNLTFTTDAKTAIEENNVIFIAVGTPSKKGGEEADLSAVYAVAKTIKEHANGPKIVVQKSTVPVGTGKIVEELLNTPSIGSEPCYIHDMVSNPEFLKEGVAVSDFESPDRVIVGTDSKSAENVLRQIYAPFMLNRERMIFMSRSSAELTKVFANTMLAMRISAMNSITSLAEEFGADITEIRKGIGSDPRIGTSFLYTGGATYGGSCFPKDVRALAALMMSLGLDANLFLEVMNVNRDQRARFIGKILSHFNNSMTGKRVAIWGLSFKPGTDDVREAASFDVVNAVVENGGNVVLFDEYATDSFHKSFGENENVIYCDEQYLATKGADALIILTDAKDFRSLDLERLDKLMKKIVIFDGKNLHDPLFMAKGGAHYVCMGRPFYPPVIR